jgi:hypothetical protein
MKKWKENKRSWIFTLNLRYLCDSDNILFLIGFFFCRLERVRKIDVRLWLLVLRWGKMFFRLKDRKLKFSLSILLLQISENDQKMFIINFPYCDMWEERRKSNKSFFTFLEYHHEIIMMRRRNEIHSHQVNIFLFASFILDH